MPKTALPMSAASLGLCGSESPASETVLQGGLRVAGVLQADEEQKKGIPGAGNRAWPRKRHSKAWNVGETSETLL